MNTKTSAHSYSARHATAAFCVLLMLALLPASSHATVKKYRVNHKNDPNLTHHWTFEGSTPLNDKKGTSALIKNPNTGAPEIVGGYNPVDSKALLLSGTNGYNNLLANGDPNAVYFGTNIAFEVVFRADQAVHTADGGVAWILNTRSDDNSRRGYLLFQGELGAAPGGTGLGSVVGNSFGNVANGNRVANALVVGHWYYVAGSYDTVAGGTTTMTHYIADLTAGETTLTVVGPVTTPAGSTAPVNEHVRLGIGNRYDGVANYFQGAIEDVSLYSSNKLDQATFQAHLNDLLAAPHDVAIGGELIVDLNINRGLMLDINPVGGLPNGAYYWTNYGTAGGQFQSLTNPPFQTGRTNPFTYQDSGGSNSVYSVGGQGFQSTFTMPTTVSGQSAGVGKPYTAEVWFWPNRYRANMDRVLCFGTDPTASAACIIGYGNGRGMENGGGAGVVNWPGQSAANNALWYHMVNTYDGTTSILYTNGVEMGRNTINLNIADNRKMLLGTGNQGDPNYNNTVISAIGGFMAARVHSQALTPAQVLNNFQVGDQVPVINITVQNLAVTAVDIHSATVNGNLTVTTDPSTTELTVYYGLTDQGSSKVGWAGSVTLGAPQNTGAFSIPLTGLADNTAYICRIYGQNDNGEGWSGVQSFTTPPQAPAILNVSSRGQPNAVFVTWDRPMNATAINFENYELNGPLVLSASFSSGNTEVKLITETLTEGTTYTLTANNSQDLALGLPVVPNTQKIFTHGAGYGLQAPITMKRYDSIGGTAVANLTGAAAYPNSPTSTNTTLTSMSTPNGAADNYGWWMYGYFVAPESGNYNFHTSSDDASEVWITVGGIRTKVSQETGCCGGPKPTITPVNLVAGQAYFLEQLGKEGGGGDYGIVSVQSPNNLFGYLGDGNNASPAIPASAFAQTRIGSGTPFNTLGLVFFPLPPSNHTSLVSVDYTFAATLDGTPPYSTPQWFRNGVLIPGATSLSYTAAAIPANNGAVYTLMVTGVCNIASASATFTVLSDTFPPTLVSATPGPLIGGTYVDIVFSETVELGSAQEPNNYAINGGALDVMSAVRTSPNTVRLTTDPMTRGAAYTVVVNDVYDMFNNPIAPNSAISFTGADFPGGVVPVAWYDASQITGLNNNDTVNSWNDSSGNGHHASGGNGLRTYVTSEVNGHPVVKLRNDGYFQDIAGSMLAREQYIVFRVPAGGDWGAMLGSDIRAGYMFRQDGRFWDQNFPDQVKENGIQLSNLTADNTVSNRNTYMVLKITGNINNGGGTARTGWHIGRSENDWHSLFLDLAEIIAFDHPLTLAEEARVSKSLGNKYGIALPYTDVLEVGSRGVATTVYVSYLDPMDPVTAGNAANYAVSGGVTVQSATIIDSTTVRLTVTPMVDGSTLNLTITGVRKASAGNPFIAPNPSVVAFQNNFPPGGVSLGMVAWFDASRITGLNNNDTVNSWNDSSGNGHHASGGNGQRTYVTGEINGHPAVQLRGDGYFQDIAGSMLAREQYIVFRNPSGGDWGAMLGSSIRAGYMFRQDGRFWDQNTPDQVKQNGVQLSNLTADNTVPNRNTYMVLKITGNINNGGGTARSGWHIGRTENDWHSLNLDIAEIVAFDRLLSFTEEARVSAALGVKYGISLPAYADVLTVSSRGNPNAVYVSYLDAMDPATAGDPGNYDLGAGPLVLGATMLDANTVKLDVETMPDTYQTYTLTITGVKKATLAFISPNPTVKQFTHGAGYENYGLTRKRYHNMGAGDIPGFRGWIDTHVADVIDYPPTMEIPTNVEDNYGIWMYGLFVAPSSGNYTFHTSSDDQSQVWLSTDENPANRQLISEQGNWSNPREYQGGSSRTLVGGQKYYLEFLMREGGGGDNGAVAVEEPGNILNYHGNGSDPVPATRFYAAGHRFNGVSFLTLGDVSFTVQPTNATVVDGYPLLMVSVVDGTPPYNFQWKSNGVPIPGGTNATYATLANNGLNGVQFSVCVSNEFSGTCSTNATITINGDFIRPTLVLAQGKPDLTHVTIRYSEAMEAATAADFNNYEISGGVSVTAASMIDATNVLLTTSAQTPGTTYTVTVNDVRDNSSNHNPILAGASINFRAFPLVNCTFGQAFREFYENFQGDLNTYRDSTEAFKNNPNNVAFQNNWNWGGCCDTYVVRLSGYIIPPVSGNYTFRVNRDDDARLFISTDETQANKGNPIIDVGCCGDADTSPIALVANTPYYVEAWVREGGGGDYLRVFWKNGTTIPNFSEMDGNNIAYAANVVISQDPVDQTVQANSSVTFTVAGVIGGSGHGPKYQWHVSSDNGMSYSPIGGATSASYTHQAGIGENGYKYRCVLSADDNVTSGTSAPATLTVEADTIRPTLVSAKGDASQVTLVFSEPVTQATVEEINNYSILTLPSLDELSVLGAVQISPNTVRLTTAAQTPGVTYEVHVSFVDDTASPVNTILPDSTIQFVSKLWPGGVSAGIAAWYDASDITGLNNNDSVETWNDRSDNGHTATGGNGQRTYVTGELNGHPVVKLRGDGYFQNIAGSMLAREQYIVFRVQAGGDWGSMLGSDIRAGYMFRQDGRFWDQNIPDEFKQNGVVLANPTADGAVPNRSQYMILKITGNVNNGGGSARTGWHIGRQENDWHSLNLDIAEIVAYDRLLTLGEENSVGAYLAAKYAISTTYPDGLPPVLVGASPACDLLSVNVTFNKAVAAGTAGNAANYSITNSAGAVLAISAATVLDSKHVKLTTTAMTPGTSYVLVVNGVTDTETPVHTIAANSTAGFTAVTCTTLAGAVFREIYDGIGGNTIPDLTGNAAFIAGNPTSFDMLTEFQSNDRGDSYGLRVSGHIIPTESGNYTFQIENDDDGQIFLSTDDGRANRVLIVNHGCCGTADSAVIPLVAGQAYYVEGMVKEGGGGDYLRLRWKNNGAIPNFTIIPGANLAYRYSLTINQNPVDQTVLPGNNATFTVGATPGGAGIVLKYQWQRSADYGATFDPIPGANSATYVRLVGGGDDNTQYRCAVSLLGNFQTNNSAAAVLNPVIDNTRPTLVSAVGQVDRTKLRITFSEGVTPGTATDNNSYSITNLAGDELSVSSGVMINSTTVELTTALQSPETAYVVVVNYVQDASPVHNEILPNSTISFTSSPVGLGGVLLREFYEGIGGNAIGNLTDSAAFRAGLPTSFDFINSFNSASHGDDYGVRVSGILTPTETGTYTFQINNDDDGRIFLSTDATQGNKVQILDHGCCGTQDSATVNLIAGQKYYIEGLVKEGGGGDYLELRWKNTGAIPSFTIIPGANLSYLYSLSITQQPVNQIYASNPGTVLLSEDFSTGDGGFTVTTPLAYDGPWVYNLGTGSWRENGQGPGNGQGTNESSLTSPAMVLTTAGGVTLSFNHRHSFESGFWDGGQVRVSVNGGAFIPVSPVNFTQNGYNGSAIAVGAASFVEDSAGFGANTFITSSAYLGSFNNGDSIRVQFRAVNDENTTGNQAPPSWEIDSMLVKQGVSAPAVFTVGANQGYAAHARYQWQRSDDNGATYNPVVGAVDASYQLFPVPADIGALFKCQVSLVGDFQTNVSASATLYVRPIVTSSSFSGGAFHLSFPSLSGVSYTVEYAETFDGSVAGEGVVWQTLQTVNGDGSVKTVDDVTGATLRFYRVRIP